MNKKNIIIAASASALIIIIIIIAVIASPKKTTTKPNSPSTLLTTTTPTESAETEDENLSETISPSSSTSPSITPSASTSASKTPTTSISTTKAPNITTTIQATKEPTNPPVIHTINPNIQKGTVNVKLNPSTTSIDKGKKFQINIVFEPGSKINNCNFAVKYDIANFSYVSSTIGSIVPSEVNYAAGFNNTPASSIVVAKYVDPTQGNNPISGSGTFASLTFEASSQATSGSYTFSLIDSSDTRYGYDFADSDLNQLKVTPGTGTVKIN